MVSFHFGFASSRKMSQKISLLDAFKDNILILKIVGIWKLKSISYAIYRHILIFVISSMYLSTIIEIFLNTEELFENLYLMGAEFEGPLKLIFFRRHFQKVLKTIAILKSKYFQPLNKTQKKILESGINLSKLVQKTYFLLTAAAIGILFFPEYYKNGYNVVVFLWIPFDYRRSGYFECIYSYILLASIYTCYINISSDSFFYTSMIQIGAQFDCIANTMEESNAIAKLKKKTKRKILVRCIKHYDLVINYVQLIHEVYKQIIAVQMLFSTISLCTTLYSISIVRQNLNNILYFNFCFLGI